MAVFTANESVIDASAVGLVADGTTLNTNFIQTAIDNLAATGGGALRFTAGRYLTGTIQIKSNVRLHLERGAVLLGSTDVADYRNLDPFLDGGGAPLGHALIIAIDAENVGIEGPGTVDGQSPALKAKQTPYLMRPFLLRWVRCRNVTVRDVHLTNPGAWTLNFYRTNGAIIEGVTIRTRGIGLHNCDGINIDSSQHIRVHDCDVISGDDALVIKSTGQHKSRDISASDCRLSTGANGIKIGTESFGGFENISISNCHVFDTGMAGIAIYAVDGGDLRNVIISDVTIDSANVAIAIRLGGRLKTFRAGDKAKATPGKLCDVIIRNVRARYIGMIGVLINGIPDYPIESLTLENIHLLLPGRGLAIASKVELPENETDYPEYDMFGKIMPAYGIYARHVRGLCLTNVQAKLENPDARASTVLVDVDEVNRDGSLIARGTLQPAAC